MQRFFSLLILGVVLLMHGTPAQMQSNEAVFQQMLSATGYMGVLAWSADGQSVWTTERANPNADGSDYYDTIRLFDVATGGEVMNFRYVGSNVGIQATLSQDESRLLVWQGDSAQIHDARTGATLVDFPHDGWIDTAQWNPDESRLLTSSYQEGVARVWDANTGALLATIDQHRPNDLIRTHWNADATLIVTALTQTPSAVAVWDNDGNQIFALPQAQEMTYEVEWSPNGQYLAVTRESTVELWDVVGKKLLNSVQATDGGLMNAVWSPDSMWLAVSAGAEFYLWSSSNGVARMNQTYTTSAFFNHTSTQLALVGDNTQLSILSLGTPDESVIEQTYEAPTGSFMSSPMWSPDDSRLFYMTGDSMMHMVNTTTNTALWDISDEKVLTLGIFTTVAEWNASSTHFVLFGDDASARVYNVADGTLAYTLHAEDQGFLIMRGQWSADGKQVLLESDPNEHICTQPCRHEIAVWNIE